MVVICNSNFDKDGYTNHFNTFPFELSDFQKWAIYSTINSCHCLVTAHTGSGKTIPAEFAISYFKAKSKKLIYTAPIKALCNQKLHDMRLKFPNVSVGILTGDIKDNPDADVLIMTTEILRNTLLSYEVRKKDERAYGHFEMDIENELGAVVFDEVHYIGDQDRGSVWEQAILMLPKKVQLILLSATIEKPHIFAEWIEKEKETPIYLISTNHRVVPLTHYLWTSVNKHITLQAKNTKYENLLKTNTNKLIKIADSNRNFEESNYHKMNDIIKFIRKNKNYVARQHVLNDLVSYLFRNDMLPAICFVFSRKNVERFAKEINVNLFKKDDKTPNIIEHECEKILISKLKNYREYLNLDEYRDLIHLLKRGIAIHHAGIMPILREMVELLFEKRYIKLLFATETFAVGINMPTKTVVFTDLNKFSGQKIRELMPHEYTQMAGRAGRRGIDKIGSVIHCSNLFDFPNINTYKFMITGPPKMLSSQFKISYNLILNIISANKGTLIDTIDEELIAFMEKSFIQNDIMKDINDCKLKDTEYRRELEELTNQINNVNITKTPKEVMEKYKSIQDKISMCNTNQKKKYSKELISMEKNFENMKTDIELLEKANNIETKIKNNDLYMFSAKSFIRRNINEIMHILGENMFLNEIFELTEKGIMAMRLNEIHPLAICDLYEKNNGFNDLNEIQIIQLFSCFTNISCPDDIKLQYPDSNDKKINNIIGELNTILDKYYNNEYKAELDTGVEYKLQYEIINYIKLWCNADSEIACRLLINVMKEEKEIFLGEFVKAILKINNIANEFEKICELNENIGLLQKIKRIPELTLKYVASNQSLYV